MRLLFATLRLGRCRVDSRPVSDGMSGFGDFLGLRRGCSFPDRLSFLILRVLHHIFCDSLKLKKAFLLISALLPWTLDKGSISWCISLSSENLLKNVEEDYFTALQVPLLQYEMAGQIM
jgi:hypothetical protein